MQKAFRKGIQTQEPTRRTKEILVWQCAPEQYVQNQGTIFIYEQYEDTRRISEKVIKKLLNRGEKKEETETLEKYLNL